MPVKKGTKKKKKGVSSKKKNGNSQSKMLNVSNASVKDIKKLL